jgi:hypothetical protein
VSLSEAPDYVEPIVGWRLWRIGRRGGEARLESPFYRSAWTPRAPLAARCEAPAVWRRRRHEAPQEGCTCGIYAAALDVLKDRLAGTTLWGWPRLAVGRVSLWGTVVETEKGWRGEFGYPSSLYVIVPPAASREKSERTATLLECYGVEVQMLEIEGNDKIYDALADLAVA